MRRRPASSRLRFSCGVGLSIFLAGAGALVAFDRLATADTAPEAAAAPPDDLVLDLGGATLETRKVPHGVFTMGSAAGEPGHEKDEEPAHQVTITKDFWIGKYPVTRGQFAKFVSDTRYVTDAEKGQSGGSGWDGKPGDAGRAPGLVQRKDFTWRSPGFTQTDSHPIVLVSYGDATAFVGWASRKSGKRVRLPTEAEWEFAARAGTTTAWSGGVAAENDPAAYGWFKPNAGNGTRPVGQKRANPLGIFDVSGNVMEWCRDVFAPYHEGAVVDPETTTVSGNELERRVLRGGSWFRDPKRGRSAARYRNAPGSRMADNGFRVVVTNEEAVTPAVATPGVDFVPGAPVGLGGNAGTGAGPVVPSASGTGGVNGAGGAGTSGAIASGPLADGEAMRVEPVGGGSEPFSWGLLLISPLAAASAVVAWMLLRRKRSPAAARAQAARAPARAGAGARAGASAGASAGARGGVSTRPGADGFFVGAPGVLPGARVRYACIVNGTEVSDVVPLDGDRETFVYTGAPPTAIRVIEIIGGRASAPPLPSRPAPPVPVRPPATQPMPLSDAPSAGVQIVTEVIQAVTEQMVMPGVPRPPPSVPRPPPSAPRPPPSSPRPLRDSPRALIVPVLEPESTDSMSMSAGATVDALASTDVDLSASRDAAVKSDKVAAAGLAPAPPAMTAAEAFKVEPIEAEAAKTEATTKAEATTAEAAKEQPTKDEPTRAETPEAKAPKVAAGTAEKDDAAKDEPSKDEGAKVESSKDEAAKDESTKDEADADDGAPSSGTSKP